MGPGPARCGSDAPAGEDQSGSRDLDEKNHEAATGHRDRMRYIDVPFTLIG